MASKRTDDDDGCKVYVGDLPRDAQEADIQKAFQHYGSVRSVWVARNPPGFAFVVFEDQRDAEDAVKDLDGTVICGVRARVEISSGKSRAKRPGQSVATGDRQSCYQCGRPGHFARDCPGQGGGGGGNGRFGGGGGGGSNGRFGGGGRGGRDDDGGGGGGRRNNFRSRSRSRSRS